MMNKNKQKKLESKGWKVGSVQDFLKLSAEESAYIELKLMLAKNLQKKRRSLNLTQTACHLLQGRKLVAGAGFEHATFRL